MDYYRQYQQYSRQKQPKLALDALQKHLAANPRHAFGFIEAGNLLRDLGQWSQALSAFLAACRLEPKNSAYLTGLGVIYNQLQKPGFAIHALSDAHEYDNDPGILYNRSMALLLAGRYQEGWQDYEFRSKVHKNRKVIYEWHPPERLWHGQPFPGQTLVVYNEQGLGDDIQFCRYLPYLKSLGGTVLFITQRSLLPVMSTLYGVEQVFEMSAATHQALKQHDWFIPLMSLPYIFNTTLDSIPNQTPYLSAPLAYRNKWEALLRPYHTSPGTKKIGIVFATVNDAKVRSCPFPMWQPLLALPGIQWFSVQKGEASATAAAFADSHPNFIDLTDHIHDFGDTAALLDELDLLISIDTSVPHLAGALGKPVWLLTPSIAQWRWLLHRCDTPWYPSFRLFRQPAPEDWQPVIDQLQQALLSLLRQSR